MNSSDTITKPLLYQVFFQELKHYNTNNFRRLLRADLRYESPETHKAFSAVVTRYFIFCEKHTELTEVDRRILYFKLKIDLISRYFSDYPDADLNLLRAFQLELQYYDQQIKESQMPETVLPEEVAV